MCKFYYVPCQTDHCIQNAQEYTRLCSKQPNCHTDHVPQPYFCGERWCPNCIKDGTWFAWKHLETQIRTQGVYQRWIATMLDGGRHYSYEAAVTSGIFTILAPLPLFTQLQAAGLSPSGLSYFHPHYNTVFYSLPIGLTEQDLTLEEKGRITCLTALTDFNLELMNRHRRALRRFHENLEVFLIDLGLRKSPESEGTKWERWGFAKNSEKEFQGRFWKSSIIGFCYFPSKKSFHFHIYSANSHYTSSSLSSGNLLSMTPKKQNSASFRARLSLCCVDDKPRIFYLVGGLNWGKYPGGGAW